MVAERKRDADAIARFHKTVLSWDYFDLRRESEKKNRKGAKGGASKELKKVRDTYKDVDDYLGVFEPLLFEEVKAQIVQGRNEEDDVQEYTGQKGAVVLKCAKDDEFYSLDVGYDPKDGGMISENDLLLLSNVQVQNAEGSVPHTAFAFVLNRVGGDQLRLLIGEYCPGLLKQCHTLQTSDSNKVLWIMKVGSLSTIVREYVGLRSIISLPFKELILSATENVSISDERSLKIPKPLMEFLDSNQNASQMDAIRAGLSRRTFVLIQGPPGTGKTQTILGILSAILHSTPARIQSKGGLHDQRRRSKLDVHEKYNHWKLASPWLYDTNPRDKIMPVDGDDGFFPTTGNDLRPEVVNSNRKYRVRVLVCAPSNSALDEIVLRVLSTGIRDENGRAYNPKIVRIGLKPHHSVQTVSMDYIVEQKLSGQGNTSAGDRDSIRASVLDEAAIVFSTLSFSGSSLFSKLNHVFDVVIIDEAAQAVEPATLVPLSNGCKQVFLVGDPLQLPATVISPTATSFGYDMSLFKRFQRAGYPVQMLKTQYRMHPEIRYFPSREFYSEALEDGPDVRIQTGRSWHAYRCFGPFAFFDIAGVESKPSQSWVNVDEVEFILLMYHKLVSKYPELKSSSRFAIISPYREQVKLFRDRFLTNFGVESKTLVDINTVDGFQGRETDVAIFSCVRAGKSIGFVGDARRMNVGITRARSSVLVVGSATTLRRDPHWSKLVESAEERDCLFKVTKPYEGFVSDENLESLRVKEDESMIDAVQSHLDELEGDAAMYGHGGVEGGEQGHGDDEDYGYGDGDDGED